MCGIVGKFFFNKSNYHDSDLDQMLHAIVHRGPDSEGRFGDERALLGFRRLSIIDTSSGNQPLFSEDGRIVVIANGEIYNYKELKVLLEKNGHRFRTGSDCEVIVHLYEEFGKDFVDKLNGMFAFCIYDSKKERLILVRDRVGIKPLYFFKRDGVLIFGSEIKAILQAKEVDCIESSEVLEEYLCFRALSGKRTFFSGVEQLTPGSILEATPSGVKIERYWEPRFQGETVGSKAIQSIRKTLRDAVDRQLMSDVPLGTQLSGGVDSSWVSTLANRNASGMKAFTVGFSEAEFDETSEAREVATRAGLEYHSVASDPETFAQLMPRIIWHNDEPLTHANSVEIYNLCKYAKGHVKVLLTGEGADELFGGYPRYYLCRLAESFQRLPSIMQPAFRFGTDCLSRGRGKKPGAFLGMSQQDLVFWNASFAKPEKVAWLFDKNKVDLTNRRMLFEQSWKKELPLLDNLLLFEFQTYLQPILLRQDKMSMGASIESRVPILDNQMVDLAFGIKAAEKIKNLKPKYLFKRSAEKDLPKSIVYKRKVGFGVPVGEWMRKSGPLGEYLDLLNDCRFDFPGVNPSRVEQMVSEHRTGILNHQDILWPLINYCLWRNVFLKSGGSF